MKNTYLLFVFSLLACLPMLAQIESYPLPFEVKDPQQLGTFQESLFFSNELPQSNAAQLWQFNTQTEQVELRTGESDFLIDFIVTSQGVLWLEKSL
ncbi:MAG: hypothetical protein AAF242_17175, partial [Bacteroidota bacterium]